jgi:hypothetical protein
VAALAPIVRRRHRNWHRRIWLVLPVLMAALLVAALAVRPPAPPAGEIRAP